MDEGLTLSMNLDIYMILYSLHNVVKQHRESQAPSFSDTGE